MIKKGDFVTVTLPEPGPVVPRRWCEPINCIVLNAGEYECDLIISPAEYDGDDRLEDLATALHEAGLESFDDIKEGPVYVLRNCNTEWVKS